MIDTKRIRTKQEFYSMNNPKGKDFVIGLDLGYSGVKAFYESGRFCVPSYVKYLPEGVTVSDKQDILYRDEETKEIYMVGRSAQDMIGSGETNDTDAELYSRKRYGNHAFRILCNTALALAASNEKYHKDERKLVVQTGLPASYLKADTDALKRAISNNSHFSLKVGLGDWISYQFELSPDDVYVFEQPKGGLYSTIVRADGQFVRSNDPNQPDARRLLTGNTLVLDIGYGTFDFYGTHARKLICNDSKNDISMRAILDLAASMILDDTGEEIRSVAMQQCLSSEYFLKIDEESMKAEHVAIRPYVDKANQVVFAKAKEKMREVTNSFRDYDYIILDGGTSAVWAKDIKEWLSDMHVKFFPADMNDSCGLLYSNARGYYMYRYAENKRSEVKK